MNSRFALPALFALLAACSSDDDGKTPPPDYESVFATLKPATPNKLRGVWEAKSSTPDGTQVSTRILFTEGYVVGAARCIPADKSKSVVAGGAADLETTALDLPSGTIKMKGLNFGTRDGNVTCQIALNGNTYEFSVAERKLTLAVNNGGKGGEFEKVGD